MGISPSKRVSTTLTSSPDLTAACAAVYDQCLTLTQHAFPGILPYQLTTAANLLHAELTTAGNHHQSLIAKWLKSPPNRLQVDRALQITLSRRRIVAKQEPAEPIVIIGLHEFNSFAIELFTLAVVDNAAKAVRNRVPIGIGGIIGLGVLTHSGNHVIGTAIGAYALGVATSVYLGYAGRCITDRNRKKIVKKKKPNDCASVRCSRLLKLVKSNEIRESSLVVADTYFQR